jgi:hypothetical protein
VPNLAAVKLGTNGAITLHNLRGSVDVVVDLEGYFQPATGTSGELCLSFNLLELQNPYSMGVYLGAAGTSSADPVVNLNDELFHEAQCAEGVPQATLDAMTADPAGYYVEIDEQDPATLDVYQGTRGQLTLEASTVPLLVCRGSARRAPRSRSR